MIQHQRHFPGPKRPAALVYLSVLAYFALIMFLARLAFLGYLAGRLEGQSLADILKALYIGFRFDLRWAAILSLPAGLLLSLPPLRRRLGGWRGAAKAFYFLALAALWLVYFVDMGFFLYLGERLNATIIELAADIGDGLSMVWQSYPVPLLAAAYLALLLLSFRPLSRLLNVGVKECRSKKSAALAWIFCFLVFAVSAYGQLSSNFFPLRWSQAYFTTNQDITALALNPLQNLYDTYRASRDDGFDLEAAREAYPLLAGYLGVDKPDVTTLNYARRHAADPAQTARPNVVIILMESFSFAKSSLAPGGGDHTPFMEKLVQESVYFPHFFANARTTARGVFSTITGVPDVTQSSTGSRNQRVIDQRIVANQFAGYEKYYLLGGNTNWANIRGIIGNNIEGVKILEEGYWKSPNSDVWGVHDYDLLMEANDLFGSQGGRPFLAVIQTASFHKPFTILDGVPFERRALSKEVREAYGFVNEDEYNALRFFDYSLEEFFRRAKESGYYDDTVFLLFGDHGINDPSGNMTQSYKAAQLYGWHVPLVIHGPRFAAPQVREDAASQVDVFPTAAGLAGVEYTNWTLGRDLFGERVLAGGNAAFISGKNDVPIRLVQDGWCYVDNRSGGQYLYLLSDDSAKDYKNERPERFRAMRELAHAYQVTAKYMLYNNKKRGGN